MITVETRRSASKIVLLLFVFFFDLSYIEFSCNKKAYYKNKCDPAP